MQVSGRSIMKKILRVSLMHRISIDRAIIDKGLYSGQFPVLDYVVRNNGCTQAQLAQAMQVSAPSVARSVARMERAGLIRRTGDEKDRRCNQLSATPAGIEIAKQCRGYMDEYDQRLFCGFTEEEICLLSGYLDRMIKNLSTDNLKDDSMFSLVAQAMQLHKANEPNAKKQANNRQRIEEDCVCEEVW